MVPERRDERPGWASKHEDTSPRARRLPGLVKRAPRKCRRVCRARHNPAHDGPRVIIRPRRATLRSVIIPPGARWRGGGPRRRSARTPRRRAPPARRARPRRRRPRRSRLVPGAQHSSTPSPCSSSSRSSGAAASARRRPATSRRRRSASSGPNRPSGSASSARASARRPASVRASTAANRPATSTDTAPPGAAARGERADGGRDVVDHLEQAVAQHEIGLAERGDLGEPLDLAGHGRDQLVDPRVASPAAQGGERVGAGVDDRHRAPRRGQRHGPGAAAAADVQHAGRAAGRAVADRGELGGHRAVHRAAEPPAPPARRWPTSVLVTGATSPFVVPPPRLQPRPCPVDPRGRWDRGRRAALPRQRPVTLAVG